MLRHVQSGITHPTAQISHKFYLCKDNSKEKLQMSVYTAAILEQLGSMRITAKRKDTRGKDSQDVFRLTLFDVQVLLAFLLEMKRSI